MFSRREAFSIIFFGYIVATFITGCSVIQNGQQQKLRVSWGSNLTILPFLAEGAEPKIQEDLSALLNKTWYASIQVQNAKTASVHSIDNCNTYFDNSLTTMLPLSANENAPFLELRIMCEATKLLANANNAIKKFLPSQILTPNLPYLLSKMIKNKYGRT